MEQSNLLHHYTSIETLALILKNGQIRFNRLDKVNDLMEAEKHGDFYLSKLIYVSCWTYSNKESIPLWNIYSKMKGVKITLPTDPFSYQFLAPTNADPAKLEKEPKSFFSPQEFVTENYFIDPSIFYQKERFIRKIEYMSDEKFHHRRNTMVNLSRKDYAKSMAAFSELAGYKTERWHFEQEIRYIIGIIPTQWVKNIDNLDTQLDHDKHYFDIPLDHNKLDNIIVTLGPHASEGAEIIVEDLLKKYTKNGQWHDSDLKYKIRPSN